MPDILQLGQTGLMASKKGLHTTGHNIANANTEGFSRQRIDQRTNAPVIKGGLILGTGTHIKNINRVHDPFLEQRINGIQSDHEYFDHLHYQLSQVESIFNDSDGNGLNLILGKFFNSFRELATRPENESLRYIVRDTANNLAKDIKRIEGQLESIHESVNDQISSNVEKINEHLDFIADLNKKIVDIEASGETSGDLRDLRDKHISDLSEYFALKTYSDTKGNLVVSGEGIGTLVVGGVSQKLAAGNVLVNPEDIFSGKKTVVFYQSAVSEKREISSKFRQGKMASLVEVRDQVVSSLRNKIDGIAYALTQSVNSLHKRGVPNKQIGEEEEITRTGFFKELETLQGAASQIDLSELVKEDVNFISTALEPNAAGDNRIALAISKLQHEKFLAENTTSLEEVYLKAVGSIGVAANKALSQKLHSEGILAQTKNIKERISGVSIDEETANMVRYQHAYEASAKVMQTANTLFDVVLGIKR